MTQSKSQLDIKFHASHARRLLIATGLFTVVTALAAARAEHAFKTQDLNYTGIATTETLIVGAAAAYARRKASDTILEMAPDPANAAQEEKIIRLQISQANHSRAGLAPGFAGSGAVIAAHGGVKALAAGVMVTAAATLTDTICDYISLTKIVRHPVDVSGLSPGLSTPG